MALVFMLSPSQMARGATGSRSIGSFAKVRAQRLATLSCSRSHLPQKTPNQKCPPIYEKLSPLQL